MVTSAEEAERAVYWDRWEPQGDLDAYRETDFETGFLVFVVGVLPRGYDLDARTIEYSPGTLRYDYGKIEMDSTTEESEDALHYVYAIHKWVLNGHAKPDEFEFNVVEGSPTPPEGGS